MNEQEIRTTIQGLSAPRILIVGDLILDRYLFGKVERLSPEAPVPILEFSRDVQVLGGAANVAHNVVAMGGQAIVVGLVGDDDNAHCFRELLDGAGVQSDGLILDSSRPTTVKTRVIGGQQQICRVDREQRHDVKSPALESLLAFVSDKVPHVDAVVISDYGKGCITTTILDHLRLLASRYDLPFVVDPKDTHFSNYRSFTVITPNINEASLGAGFKIKDEETLIKAGESLMKALGTQAILVTRGADGMSLFRRNEDVLHIPTRARQVYDVTGAGDTVVSILALGLASGLDMVRAAHVANWSAGVVVAKNGTATLTRDELIQYVRRFAA